MMNNIGMLIQMMKGSGNPQQMAINILQNQMGGNPMAQNVIKMISSGDTNGIEELARNLCVSKNINPEQMISDIQKKLG